MKDLEWVSAPRIVPKALLGCSIWLLKIRQSKTQKHWFSGCCPISTMSSAIWNMQSASLEFTLAVDFGNNVLAIFQLHQICFVRHISLKHLRKFFNFVGFLQYSLKQMYWMTNKKQLHYLLQSELFCMEIRSTLNLLLKNIELWKTQNSAEIMLCKLRSVSNRKILNSFPTACSHSATFTLCSPFFIYSYSIKCLLITVQ